MDIYLIRHGRILAPRKRRYIGRTDLPLIPEGRWQMDRVAASMTTAAISAIYTSPLKRARESAGIIADRLKLIPQIEPGLTEIDLGTWDGLPIEEVQRRFPDEYARRGKQLAVYRTPGGESFSDLKTRSMAALDRIVQKNSGNILIVAHAGVNRVLLCDLMGLELGRLFEIKQNYGCINLIKKHEQLYRIAYTNRSPSDSKATHPDLKS